MNQILPKTLPALAKACPAPLYVVGGSVRDFLSGLVPSIRDWDVCSPLPAEQFAAFAQNLGFKVKSVYKNTGTVKLCDEYQTEYEYAQFRSDKYVRGVHTPAEVYFTENITLDAKRRDFTCNAVYYDVKKDEFIDPLNGIPAIKEKRLSTVAPAKKVFGEDGLRLMRLARQAAQLGFSPDEDCLNGAKENAKLILDVTPERVFTELNAILLADKKYGVEGGQYRGLKLLEETGVLDYVLPELTLGKGMTQRPDFHKYDVLEHSLRAVAYADESVRYAALLHDVGKPFCTLRDGTSYSHPEEGARIVREILSRLKAPKKLTDETVALVSLHMYDFNCKTGENKLRRFLVERYSLLPKLLNLKQADFSACMDDVSPAPTCVRWTELIKKMQKENVPFTQKQLALSGKDLLDAGFPAPQLSTLLQKLLTYAATHPSENNKRRLLKMAQSLSKE